ncbi:MAG: hypothetical protein WCT31_02925 [Candidatus Micrarchaeia archaeon]
MTTATKFVDPSRLRGAALESLRITLKNGMFGGARSIIEKIASPKSELNPVGYHEDESSSVVLVAHALSCIDREVGVSCPELFEHTKKLHALVRDYDHNFHQSFGTVEAVHKVSILLQDEGSKSAVDSLAAYDPNYTIHSLVFLVSRVTDGGLKSYLKDKIASMVPICTNGKSLSAIADNPEFEMDVRLEAVRRLITLVEIDQGLGIRADYCLSDLYRSPATPAMIGAMIRDGFMGIFVDAFTQGTTRFGNNHSPDCVAALVRPYLTDTDQVAFAEKCMRH